MAGTPWRQTSNSLNQRPNSSSLPAARFNALMLSFFCCTWRSRSRILMLLTGFVVTVLLLLHVLSSRLEATYQGIVAWSTPGSVDIGDLRIVVFGSQDVLGSATDGSNGRSTWTERLCSELKCSSLVSFVPKNGLPPGLTSNRIYDDELQALQQITKHTNITEKPALENSFIADQYPVPAHTPDLEGQIRQFLSLPLPQKIPRQTLWMFTFGTWDIWNLAAMPSQSGERVVDALTSKIFSQVEFLYRESLNAESPAFSDFWSNATKTGTTSTTLGSRTGSGGDKVETFRLVIPQLFDISLTPGWQSRPIAPMPHSKAEQMRNAAALTSRWNSNMRSKLENWELKGSSMSMVDMDFGGTLGPAKSLLEFSRVQAKQHDEATETLDGPYPRRKGVQADTAAFVLDAMTEEELQREGLKDGNGLGTLEPGDAMRFLDVWNPCVADRDLEQGQGEECDVPNDYLFYDAFTVGQRGRDKVGKMVAQSVLETLFSATGHTTKSFDTY